MRRNVTNWDEVPIVMDIVMAARIVGQTPESIKHKCQQGLFPAYKEGKEWRIEKDLLKAYMRSRCVMPSIAQLVESEAKI